MLTPSETFIVRMLTIELYLVVATQKLAMPLSTSAGKDQVAMALIIHFAFLALLAIRGLLYVEVKRALLYCLFVITATVAIVRLPGDSFSLPAFLIAAIILSTYVFVIPLRFCAYLQFLKNFSTVAFIAAILMMSNWAQQLAGLGLVDLDKIIPDILVLRYFNYMHDLYYGSPFFKPHGIFFLEVSFASQFVGIGAIIELIYFKRKWHLITQFVALATSFGGTGLLLIIATFPLLVMYLRPLTIVVWCFVGLSVTLFAAESGYLDRMLARTNEFSTPDTSGHTRFVLPFEYSANALSGPIDKALFGQGPGTMPRTAGAGNRPDYSVRGADFAWSPYSKAVVEYGFIVLLTWFALVTAGMFGRGVPFIFGWMAALQYHLLNASFGMPLPTVYAFLLAGGYLITDRKQRARRAAAVPPNPMTQAAPLPGGPEAKLARSLT